MSLKAVNAQLQSTEAVNELERALRAPGSVQQRQSTNSETKAAFTPKREAVRVLFITTDTRLLHQATRSLDGYLELTDVFDEVHILVLRTGIPAKNPILRIAENGWLYTATAKHRFGLLFAGWHALLDHVVFAEGFRPDLIVARDCFESAAIAYAAGRHFDRPTQVYVPQYMLEKRFAGGLSWWWRLASHSLLKRFMSVRTDTEQGVVLLRNRLQPTAQCEVLPRYVPIGQLAPLTRERWLAEKYPQFTQFIVIVSNFEKAKTLFSAVDVMRKLLKNPRLGCIVVGNGQLWAEFQQRVVASGVAESILFERSLDEAASYFRAADCALIIDNEALGDKMVAMAAASGCAVVTTPTPRRVDVYSEGESIFFVTATDVGGVTKALTTFVTDSVRRELITHAAQEALKSKMYLSSGPYQEAYRASIESAVIL